MRHAGGSTSSGDPGADAGSLPFARRTVVRFACRIRAEPGVLLLEGGNEPGSAVPPGLPSARKRLQFSGDAGIDLVVFQELPLPVRSRVLREGQVLFARDEEALYAVALTTVRDFELFRPIYHAYLDQVGRD